MKFSRFIGAYLLFSAITSGAYYALNYSSGASELLWYCNVALLVLSAAFFINSSVLATAVLICAIPAQFFWIVGNLFYLAGGEPFGRFRWLLNEMSGLGIFFELNYHFAVFPASIYAVWKYGYHRHGFRAAVLIFISLLILSRLLTKPEHNINCMFYPCDVTYTEAVVERFGLRYTAWRCGYFAFFTCLIHLVLLKILPDRFKTS
ncbi:MAG TPA: hypothetical protein VJA17_01080 [Candidatus Omnitrophota bacterium]|nr:hypothetical protein [Candidatus Omnitrophota bacterium]